MNIQTISIVMAATILLTGCGKQSNSSGTALSPASGPGGTGAAATEANITGAWKWVAPANPDGKAPDITFTLKQQGEILTGTVVKTSSTEAITNGAVRGDAVSFQTSQQKQSGLTTTTYSGKISGDKIRGTVETDAGGRKLDPQDWEADRVQQ